MNTILGHAFTKLSAAGAEIIEIDDTEFNSDLSFKRLNVNNFEFRPLFERYLAELGSIAPVKTVKAYVEAGKYPEKTMGDYLANAVKWKAPLEMKEYHAALVYGYEFRAKVLKMMSDRRIDAFAYPAQKRPSLRLTEATRPERNGVFASALGFPAVDIPAGFTAATIDAPAGIPVGLDLMGAPFSDASLLGLAGAVEQILAARRMPPPTR